MDEDRPWSKEETGTMPRLPRSNHIAIGMHVDPDESDLWMNLIRTSHFHARCKRGHGNMQRHTEKTQTYDHIQSRLQTPNPIQSNHSRAECVCVFRSLWSQSSSVDSGVTGKEVIGRTQASTKAARTCLQFPLTITRGSKQLCSKSFNSYRNMHIENPTGSQRKHLYSTDVHVPAFTEHWRTYKIQTKQHFNAKNKH